MVPDTAGVAHAAGGDDDVKAGELGDRLAFLDCFGEPELRRIKQVERTSIRWIEACGVLAENLGGADRERRIEENRCSGYFAAFHQIDQIDD